MDPLYIPYIWHEIIFIGLLPSRMVNGYAQLGPKKHIFDSSLNEVSKSMVCFFMRYLKNSGTTNFYNDAFKRAGYEEDAVAIQTLWLAGKRDEAAKRVPDAMVTEFQALGTRDMIAARLKAYQEAGVTTLKLGLDGAGPLGPARFELLEEIVEIVNAL